MTRALRTLVSGIVDHAALFPPAALSMPDAALAHAHALRSGDAWMLSRFVCPASRLREFSAHAAALMPGTFATSGYREQAHADPWRVSALVGDDLSADLDTIDAFNAHHAREENGLALIDAIEVKAPSASFIDGAMDAIPDDLFPFFEISLAGDCRGVIAALAGEEAGAKVRTGGVTPDAFPRAESLADFVLTCAQADVPFKATAGLHHPLRGSYALTYQPAAPCAPMFGFVGLFLGAALLRTRTISRDDLVRVLLETDAGAFAFRDEHASWRDASIDTAALARVRESFALTFGSCSFDDPRADLRRLGWLSTP
ncbi:MAG: hypothetical protein IT439_10025 [Phycisphaerales bacterium]|nr:hypothetical protein [Phycisphaerales bacterium]